jgi:hypothetical protein
MDFDQMLEIWRAQNTEAAYEVNREALRKSLQAEQARIGRELRNRRWTLWFMWVFGAGMAIWAGFWIAITLTNGWSAIYVITSAASAALFAFGVGAVWVSRGPRAAPRRDFGSPLHEEVRRNLALVEHQLSLAGYWFPLMLGTGCIMGGTGLFFWTVNSSQDIPAPGFFGGWPPFIVVFAFVVMWAFRKERDEMREAKPKLELRRDRLRELLETLGTDE